MNLDCDSYNHKELLDLFGLNETFTQFELLDKRRSIEGQLKRRNNLGVEKQRQIMFFLDTVVNRLINTPQINNNNLSSFGGSWTAQTNPVIQEGSNFIITNQNEIVGKQSEITGGRNAMSTEAPPGYINPINVRSTIQAINIDTRFRPDYYKTRSTDFTVKLPSIQKKVVGLRVGSIEMPMSYHGISRGQGNNTMLIINNNSTDAWLVTLPDGNYEISFQKESNASHIETAMNNAIALATPGIITDGTFVEGTNTTILNPSKDICFTVDRISGRSIFALPVDVTESEFNTSGFTLRFNVDNDGKLNMETNIQMRLGWQLGFRAAQYKGKSAVSEGICATSGPRYAFLSIDDRQKNVGNSFIAAFANSSMDSNIITRINLSAVMDDVGVYKATNDPGLNNQLNRTREYFGPVDIMNLTIKLLDEYGRIIDLNNMDWSFALSFEKLYD